jgi:hypothetical protein
MALSQGDMRLMGRSSVWPVGHHFDWQITTVSGGWVILARVSAPASLL